MIITLTTLTILQTKDAAAVDPQPPVAPDTEPSAPSAESKFEDDLEYALALSMQPNATTNVPPSHSRSSVLPEEGEGYSAEADAAERARRADRSQVAGAADLRAASRRGRSSSNRQQSGARGPEPSNQACVYMTPCIHARLVLARALQQDT